MVGKRMRCQIVIEQDESRIAGQEFCHSRSFWETDERWTLMETDSHGSEYHRNE
jgi:hypothetical protein